jgi:hypothetical protein
MCGWAFLAGARSRLAEARCPKLTDDQLRDRRDLFAFREADADQRGSGRNPKARRQFRLERERVEVEMARRGLL